MCQWFILAALTGTAFCQRTIPLATPNGNLEVVVTGAHVDKIAGITMGSILEGSVRNPTNVDVTLLRFELIYLDQDGQELDVCNVLMSADRICAISVFERIPRGGSVPLSSPGNKFYPGKSPPKKRVISGFGAQLLEYRYSPRYVIETKVPESSHFDIAFAVDPSAGISFDMKNKLESPIEIIWDQSSFIDLSDESSRIVRSGVKYIDMDRPQPNTLVPPLAKLSETVYPVNFIRLVSSNWSKAPLLPTNLSATFDAATLNGLVGKSLRLFLRMVIEDKKVNYLATFTIKEIQK